MAIGGSINEKISLCLLAIDGWIDRKALKSPVILNDLQNTPSPSTAVHGSVVTDRLPIVWTDCSPGSTKGIMLAY